jgi:hypothetical protein
LRRNPAHAQLDTGTGNVQLRLYPRGGHSHHPPHFVAKMPGHDLWMAFLRDPDRNLLGLMCEVPA